MCIGKEPGSRLESDITPCFVAMVTTVKVIIVTDKYYSRGVAGGGLRGLRGLEHPLYHLP